MRHPIPEGAVAVDWETLAEGYWGRAQRAESAIRDLVSVVANATDISVVLRSHEYAKAQRILTE